MFNFKSRTFVSAKLFTSVFLAFLFSFTVFFNVAVVSAQSVALKQFDRSVLGNLLCDSSGNFLSEYELTVEYKNGSDITEKEEGPFILVTVLNEDESNSDDVGSLISDKDEVCAELKKSDSSTELLFNYRGYSQLSKSAKKNYINGLTDLIRSSEITSLGRQQLYNIMAEYDDNIINNKIGMLLEDSTAADRTGIMLWLEDMNLIVYFKVFLGLIVILIYMWIVLSTLLDLAFLFVTPWQERVLAAAESSTDGKKSRLSWTVTPWAMNSVKKALEEDKLAVLLWLPKHALVVTVTVAVTLLLSGGGLGKLVNIFNGI